MRQGVGKRGGGVASDGDTERYLSRTRGRYIIVDLPIRATKYKAAGQNLGLFSQFSFGVNLGTIF